MTPRQRRQHYQSLGIVAVAPRKSYLGKFTPLTNIQGAWIKSLLTIWGECVGGKTRAEYRLANSRRLWGEVKESGWSDKQLSRITDALTQAHKEGFRGAQATVRAKTLLWGPVSVSEMIAESERRDDADFIEGVMLKTFKSDDPVFMVGMQFYTTRNKISDITKDLQSVAPWLTVGEARKRVRWCLEIFRAKVFLSARRALDDGAYF
ncbi:Sb49 [Enterobacter sp. FY-07]|uniref:hypothetical protein n=1 Tax=Kosakonia oryzendophytica TaxID=1005665 RepID=UPI000777A000|nr:hypothetical protein [Kosakonia oryzendophytica]AMO48872.1 Sb49 [Enterobacter sp. FY-07]WBT56622.1 hypothetical protein O9K67_15745 [Kosakonia oryzendophytica]